MKKIFAMSDALPLIFRRSNPRKAGRQRILAKERQCAGGPARSALCDDNHSVGDRTRRRLEICSDEQGGVVWVLTSISH